MDIDNLTIAEAKKIAQMFGALLSQPVSKPCELIGQKVIVRAYRAGVHYGTLKSLEGEVATLTNARRLWFWQVNDKKGISLSDVAEHGLSDASKVCAVVGTQVVIDACEVMTTSDLAQASIEAKNVYHP